MAGLTRLSEDAVDLARRFTAPMLATAIGAMLRQ